VLELGGRYEARGLRVVSVTKHGGDEEDRKLVAETASKEKMTYPCFLDADGAWSKLAGLNLVPVFLVVDREGRVAYRHWGKLAQGTGGFDQMRDAIELALARSVPN
jgi:hypothetical protein